MLHSSSKHLSSTETAPAARPAHYDTSQKLSAIDVVKERRLKAGKLVAGIAAASDSDMFKGPVSLWAWASLQHETYNDPTDDRAAQVQAMG
jgi:hypothetical protein